MSQFSYPIRCRLNPTLFCISIYYTSNRFDAFEVYFGWPHSTVCGLEIRLGQGATFGHGVLATAVLGSKTTGTHSLSSPFPLRFAALFSSAVIIGTCTWSSHRTTEKLRLGGTFRVCLVQHPSSKWGQLERVTQGHVQVLSICKGGDTTASLGKVFQCLQEGLNIFQCVSLVLSLRRIWQCFSLLPIRYLHTFKRHHHPWAFSSAGWANPSLSASPHMWCSKPLIIIHLCWTCSSTYLSRTRQAALQTSPQGWGEVINHLPWLPVMVFQ